MSAASASQAQNVLLFDTTDIVTDTNEAGFSLTQRFYLRPGERPCATGVCRRPATVRSQAGHVRRTARVGKLADRAGVLHRPQLRRRVIPGRRNVFDSTLDLTGAAFLTSPRNISPVISRLRFEAIDNLRIEWDLDYDPMRGDTGCRQSVCRLQLGPHHGRHWATPC